MPLDQIDVDSYNPKALPPAEKEMSFFDHIEELRWHIIRGLIAVVVITVMAFVAKDFIFNSVVFGPRSADFATYRVMCKVAEVTGLSGLCITPCTFNIETRDLGETFFVHLQVAIFLGLILGFPYLFWEFWRFVKPGLHEREVKAASGIVLVASMLFSFGVLFGYYVIAPFAISFLACYQIEGTRVTPTLSSYVGYMTMFTMPIGLVFELPVFVYFLAKIGIVTPSFLREYRRHMVVVILLVAGIITPSPDVMSQLLVGVPLYTLYEVSILVAERVHKKRILEEAA